ncbi:unnamed protein product, partial [Larinioides sclopetarius]
SCEFETVVAWHRDATLLVATIGSVPLVVEYLTPALHPSHLGLTDRQSLWIKCQCDRKCEKSSNKKRTSSVTVYTPSPFHGFKSLSIRFVASLKKIVLFLSCCLYLQWERNWICFKQSKLRISEE